MNKVIVSIVTAIIILGGVIWIARPRSQSTAASLATTDGPFVAEETSHYDFGTVSMSAGKVQHRFTIKNGGSTAVNIAKIYTSCMCTTATLVLGGTRFGPYSMPGHGLIPKINQALHSNESASIEVVFDPAAHGPAGVGRIQRTVMIENDIGRPFELEFTAVVTP